MNKYFTHVLENPWFFDWKQKILGLGFRSMKNAVRTVYPLDACDGINILDIGSGTGFCAAALFPTARNCVVSLDYNVDYVTFGSKHYPAIHFLAGDANHLPIVNASFDLALLSCVVHHLSDDVADSLLNSINRVLQPSGRLLFIEPIWSDSPVSNALLRHDRGKFVRTQAQYEALLRPRFEIEKTFYFTMTRTRYCGLLLKRAWR